MARQIISINELIRGAQPTDPRRTAYGKVNANFAELYAQARFDEVRLLADVANAHATPNTILDVTGLAFPVLANKLYEFEFNILYTAAATTTGSRWSISGPATPTFLNYQSEYSLTTTTTTRNALLQAYDAPAACNVTSAALGNNWALIKGVIQPSAAGNVIARFASEITVSAITAKIGSFVRFRQVTP
jgi:hypothetical protein